jgi:peptidoglycan/LPS O-acetylase OafA/YrhL
LAGTQNKNTMHPQKTRLPAVDFLKAVAAQLIVLHHLAAYGPISEAVQDVAPMLISWLYDHGRMAVQVFLVVGGYLTARSLSPNGRPFAGSHLAAIANRYLRLAVPFLAALLLAIVCAAVARALGDDDYVPSAPRLAQLAAHALLLPGLLGHEALTAGAWYVAIDLQLFAAMILLSGLAASAPRVPRLLPLLALALMAASQFGFNRDAALDNWAIYFFGAYGLGAATWWATRSRRSTGLLALVAALTVAALLTDFRGRLAVALATAAVLALAGRLPRIGELLALPGTARLGSISYSLFLIHFPVLLLANAAFAELDTGSDIDGFIAMAATWGVCIFAAVAFHRWVEAPANRLRLPLGGETMAILRRAGRTALLATRRFLGAALGVRP